VPLGIDGVAGKAAATIAGVLSQSGTLVVYALMSGEPVTVAPLDLIGKVMFDVDGASESSQRSLSKKR
jgi:hypothetical protein